MPVMLSRVSESEPGPSAPPQPAPEHASLAEVIIPRHLRRSFTYLVPIGLQDRLRPGTIVLVPFGYSALQGVVISVSRRPSADSPIAEMPIRPLREILAIPGEGSGMSLPPDLLELTRLVSERYLSPWGQCLRMILPSVLPRIGANRYVATTSGQSLQEQTTKLPPTAQAVLTRLQRAPRGLTSTSLQRTITGPLKPALAWLKRQGYVQEVGPEDPRGRLSRRSGTPHVEPEPVEPEPADRAGPIRPGFPRPRWWDNLRTALDAPHQATFLLQDNRHRRLTCLIEAAEETLSRQRTVLIIAPEIARVSIIAGLARARWGKRVELWHSGLSPRARTEAWRRIADGAATIVIGTRSAVFAPLPSLGLIGVEAEEDPALKEETIPHYHARDVALLRAGPINAALLLLTAHPSLETLDASTRASGPRGPFFERPDQPHEADRHPLVEVIDLRRRQAGDLLTEPMIAGISAALDARTGVILFLNRKGFAVSLFCRDCGAAPTCPRCSVALTFHKRAGRLTCASCGASAPLPDTCPSCFAPRLTPVGFGTERIEEEVRRLFPRARIGRFDRETARTPPQAESLRRLASAGEFEILIGTQMLLQDLPLPPAGFVGLPHAEAGLHRPDFRAAERTYHTLLDAVSLARSAQDGGRVLLQTYLPTHHVITSVANGNEHLFYDQELAFRRALAYPPFTHLINLRIAGKQAERVREAAQAWAELLVNATARPGPGAGAQEPVTILGPVPAPVARLRGYHRWQILIKAVSAEAGRRTVAMTLEKLEGGAWKGKVKFDVDVDPQEMG